MRALLLFLTFFLFLGWTAFARFYYVTEIKQASTIDAAPLDMDSQRPQTLSLEFQDSVILDQYEQFYFKKGSIEEVFTVNNTRFLDQLADYLHGAPDKEVEITGYFRDSEKDLKFGNYENIGAARAALVRQRLIDSGIPAERIWVDFQNIRGENLLEPLTFKIITQ